MELLNYISGFGGSALQYIFGFISVLMVIVFVHEMGHFLVARWCGIKVDAFSIGFGHELIGFNDRKNTRWKLCLIPLGGYVKFWGDANEASFGNSEQVNNLTDEQKKHCFHTAKLWHRAAIVVAGPMVNFLFAIAIFVCFSMFYGQPTVSTKIDDLITGGAAEQAGLQKGDLVVNINGNIIDSFSDLRKNIMFNAEKQLPITILRNGQPVSLTITPKKTEITDKFGNVQTIGRIGIIHNTSKEEFTFKTLSFPAALENAIGETWFIIKQTMIMLKDLVIGKGDIKQLGGPVKIAQHSGQMASEGILPLVRLAALLSVGIGLFNLFPIPMLDGGHLVFYLAEAILRRPLSPKIMDYASRTGVILLFSFFIFVTVNDIVSIF